MHISLTAFMRRSFTICSRIMFVCVCVCVTLANAKIYMYKNEQLHTNMTGKLHIQTATPGGHDDKLFNRILYSMKKFASHRFEAILSARLSIRMHLVYIQCCFKATCNMCLWRFVAPTNKLTCKSKSMSKN